MDNIRVLTAMSGGVDSSVSAVVLAKEGYSVSGAIMRLFSASDIGIPPQTEEQDINDARRAAENLGIDFFVFDFEDEFRRRVMEPFANVYLNGETPNPCIYCNRHLKFGAFLERALENGFNYIATGHYVRRETDASGTFLLRKGADFTKDQSYVLYSLTQEQLTHALFPVGGLTKREVREIAFENRLPSCSKKESQDICFVKNGDYRTFLEFMRPGCLKPGDFISGGKVIGRHKGAAAYTVGQRRGLGISAPEPLYVTGKDTSANTVTLGTREMLFGKRLHAHDVNMISGNFPTSPMRVLAKIRYNQKESPATLFPDGESAAILEFDSEQRAVSPGQAVVFYADDYLLGGGTISMNG